MVANTSIAVNTTLSRDRIEDADLAYETINLANTEILQPASTPILVQANALK